ncbi:Mth938-like domain-containing protein [Aquisalimonas lutea]|uniref:Mth938-like domain-containing protein n=1 Tax=Aquisalimonas lutea TaxID=1327750 RepID=UPI0025B3BB13|nr:Mth938-like domain-containing protein [Aquisalimonas lutea]MDN3518412.1 Mth938-like domain-containing protein [Aquisalimonas lutea]
MKLTLEHTGQSNRIRSYDTGTVTVNETVLTRTLLLTPERLHDDWGPEQPPGLTEAHLDELVAMQPEIVLIGTGRYQQFPDRRLMARAIQAGVGIEVMTTEAACRTYNVLAAEERHVAAVLFMIERDT